LPNCLRITTVLKTELFEPINLVYRPVGDLNNII